MYYDKYVKKFVMGYRLEWNSEVGAMMKQSKASSKNRYKDTS